MKNMKKNTMMMLALVGMTAGLTVNAEEAQTQNATAVPAQKAQVVTTGTAQKAMETAATKLSVEEQAFVAKLSDQNRKTFSDRFSADQRRAVLVAVKNGANADEAVLRMAAAKDLKDAPAVANAEKANAALPVAK
jgi:uncharacterized protein YycO